MEQKYIFWNALLLTLGGIFGGALGWAFNYIMSLSNPILARPLLFVVSSIVIFILSLIAVWVYSKVLDIN